MAGGHDLNIDDGNEQAVKLKKIIKHQDFNHFTVSHDIALLYLEKAFKFGPFVNPVTLPAYNHVTPAGTECVVSGWGTLSEGGDIPSVLQKTIVPVMSEKDCKNIYGKHDIDSTMLCAGYLEGGKDACQGDSGGPLYCDNVLIGIISWGYGCARPGYPGVYTQVSTFVKWIEKNTK